MQSHTYGDNLFELIESIETSLSQNGIENVWEHIIDCFERFLVRSTVFSSD